MDKIDELINKFKEFKEELNKNVNMSYGSAPNMAKGGMNSQDSMAMSEKLSFAKNGQWSLDKSGANEKANPSGNHNKGKFKVMEMTEEKSSKKEGVKGKPYINKTEAKIHSHPAIEGPGSEGEQQRDQNKGRSAVGP